MSALLQDYAAVVGEDVIDQLLQLAEPLKGKKVVHINSTRAGGGVAEILHEARATTASSAWMRSGKSFPAKTSSTNAPSCSITRSRAGQRCLPESLKQAYEETNAQCAEEHHALLRDADAVFIHDPQPAALLPHIHDRRGKWIWRCHIDVSHPQRQIWRYLSRFVAGYDASVFSLADFAQMLPHPVYLIPPSIDPLSEKNRELPEKEIPASCTASTRTGR